MTRWPWLAALLLLHAGCTSLTAGQQAHLDDWQRFADRVTTHYGVAEVTFLVGEHPGAGGGAMRPGGLMTFQTRMLEPLPAGQSRELDANAEAVKILMVGRHWSERRAFFHAHAYLWSYRRGVEARRVGVPAGHPLDTCVEINDLIRRYPRYRDISDACPSWPEPRWADHAAQRDAMSSEPLDL